MCIAAAANMTSLASKRIRVDSDYEDESQSILWSDSETYRTGSGSDGVKLTS